MFSFCWEGSCLEYFFFGYDFIWVGLFIFFFGLIKYLNRDVKIVWYIEGKDLCSIYRKWLFGKGRLEFLLGYFKVLRMKGVSLLEWLILVWFVFIELYSFKSKVL